LQQLAARGKPVGNGWAGSGPIIAAHAKEQDFDVIVGTSLIIPIETQDDIQLINKPDGPMPVHQGLRVFVSRPNNALSEGTAGLDLLTKRNARGGGLPLVPSR